MSEADGSERPELRVRVADGVLRLTIDREERRNALSPAVLEGMLQSLTHLDPEVRVVLLSSAGEEVFCAGADLVAMAPGATGMELHESRGGLREVVLAMRRAPVPVLARVQGLCLAGGVGLALGCDLVLASRSAAFGLPEVNLGLWPFMVSALLGRHCSPKQAFDLMLTGERISADRAEQLGLVSRVVEPARLEESVETLVAALAAKPPVAVRRGKAAFLGAMEASVPAGLAAMQAELSLLTQTADAAEGVAAFLAKRSPNWSGR